MTKFNNKEKTFYEAIGITEEDLVKFSSKLGGIVLNNEQRSKGIEELEKYILKSHKNIRCASILLAQTLLQFAVKELNKNIDLNSILK